MRTFITAVVFSFFCLYSSSGSAANWPWQSTALLTLDEVEYSGEEFEQWWKWWNEEPHAAPDLELFIDWQLKVKEAERMELFTTAQVRKKVDTFLKARTLLLLQDEEVRSKVIYSEAELRQEYETSYLPVWHLGLLAFSTQEAAASALQNLNNGQTDLESLVASAHEEKTLVRYETKMKRPANSSSAWRGILDPLQEHQALALGGEAAPYKIIYLIKKQGEEGEDFQQFTDIIKSNKRKQKERELTFQLVERLKEKYNVRVDEEIYKRLESEEAESPENEDVVLYSDKINVTVGQFMAGFKKTSKGQREAASRSQSAGNISMRWYLNSLISSSVVSWESLDRHYEERPPFSWIFRFYRENVMTKAYIAMMQSSIGLPTQEEIEAYYQEKVEQYRLPGEVRVKLLSAAPDLLRKVRLQTLAGEGLAKVVSGLEGVTLKSVTFQEESLPAAIKENIKFLSAQELSPSFSYEGKETMAQLLGKSEEQVPTLAHIQERISKDLHEQKKKEAMDSLHEKLRQHSTIAINKPLWLSITKKLQEENEQ